MKEKLSRTDLWVNQWVTVDFACRSDKKPSMCSFRQPKHIPGTQERCFDRLDRVVLKVYNNIRNSCNAEANVENICKYISYKLEAGVVEVFDQVRLSSGEERVSDDDHVALREQPVD